MIENLLLVASAAALLVYGLSHRRFWLDVRDHEQGVRRKHGRFVRLLGAGRHWLLWPGQSAELVDMRPKLLEVAAQEVPTRDQALLRISAVVRYRVSDARTLLEASSDAAQELYNTVQLALRQVVLQRDVEDALSARATLDMEAMEPVKVAAQRLGLELLHFAIKDLVAAGELKQKLAEVAKARAEGRAKLERARGETAAMRSLLNAASLVRENSGLYELRVLETASLVAESQGNSLALEIHSQKAKEAASEPNPEPPRRQRRRKSS